MLQPKQLVSRSAQIAERLREDILAGRLTAGSRLTEQELTERFSVGRGPVRDALSQLAHQGLLVMRPNRGVVVAPDPPREIRKLIVPIRQTLETYALELIFDELTQADFQKWDELLERLQQACRQEDYPTIAELDIAFHRFLVERTGQPDLLAMWEAMTYRIRSHFHRTHRRYENALDIYEEHKQILDTIRRGDEASAVHLLREKIE